MGRRKGYTHHSHLSPIGSLMGRVDCLALSRDPVGIPLGSFAGS